MPSLHSQARLALPMLAVALAVTPPILLYDDTPSSNGAAAKRRRLPAALGILHAVSVVAAVAAARFAIFDIVQWVSGARPEVKRFRLASPNAWWQLGSLPVRAWCGCHLRQ